MRPDTFPTTENLLLIGGSVASLGLLALGVTVVLAAGEFDLSVGYISSLTIVFAAGFVANQGLSWPVSFVVTIVIGILAGLVNGALVGVFGISAFVATLATGSLFEGGTQFYSHGERIYQNIPASFGTVGTGAVLGIPGPVIVFAVSSVLLWIVLDKLPTGRHIYARGANRRAAVLAGLSVQRSALAAFAIAGALAAISGIIIVSQIGSATPDLGVPYLLPAYAAAFLGSVTFRLGQFNAWGTFCGVLLLGVAQNGLIQVGAPAWSSEVFQGIILLAAVGLTVTRSRRI
ncbi:MAG: ABC transporter permease [Chloroflexota bacterium]|nr:ABC transporter permease [Chloroflexota bacterium]